MQALKDREDEFNEEKKLFSCLVDLLSYEKITFNGELMSLKSVNYRSDFVKMTLQKVKLSRMQISNSILDSHFATVEQKKKRMQKRLGKLFGNFLKKKVEKEGGLGLNSSDFIFVFCVLGGLAEKIIIFWMQNYNMESDR